MVVKQVSLEFPPEILAGIESGAYTLFGSVVRDGSRIIAHLKDAPIPAESRSFDITRFAAGIKDPKVMLLVGLGVALVGGVAIAAVSVKKMHDRKLPTPEIVETYSASLADYLTAIRSGSIRAEVLSRLLSDLDALQNAFLTGALSIEFSVEQSTALVRLVRDYTQKLARANSHDFEHVSHPSPATAAESLTLLRYYLVVQEQIVRGAA